MIEPDLNETNSEEEIKQNDKQELLKLQMNQNDIKIDEYQEQQKANNNLNFQMINIKNFPISKMDQNKNQNKQQYPQNQLKIQTDSVNNQKNDQLQQYLLYKEEQLNTERTKRLKQGDMNQLMFQTHELQNINEFIQQATGGKKTTIARKMTEKYVKRGENTIDYRQELTRKIVRKNRKILKKQDQVEKQMKFKLDPNYKQNIEYGKSLKDVVNQQFQQQQKDQKQMMEEFAVQMKQQPLVAKAKVRKILDNFEIISNDNKKSIFSKQNSQKQKQKQEDRLKKYQQIYKQSEVFQDPQNKNKNLQIKRDQLMQNILINQAKINTQKQEEEEKLLYDTGRDHDTALNMIKEECLKEKFSDLNSQQSEEQINQTQQVQSEMKKQNESKLSLNIEDNNNLFKNSKIQKPIKKISFQLQSPKSIEKEEYQMEKKQSQHQICQAVLKIHI
ncbi:hypothetical protein PPERSA_08457 [Pseudocohnilembus persalinus]|uniref:Uncharacterized protein n=1 Tax=Pseudocohnilembus persalinus TaxID=266149 RepID=A0A0V0R6C0_PSEPJ|nr:hypothetical protein PPERSA_08457 [Pseudocohnilembus persalinus]|eukprot:KRX10054.1 hypothetical protein PPERSA_08457 [Pseudocohnilembus persalinus]